MWRHRPHGPAPPAARAARLGPAFPTPSLCPFEILAPQRRSTSPPVLPPHWRPQSCPSTDRPPPRLKVRPCQGHRSNVLAEGRRVRIATASTEMSNGQNASHRRSSGQRLATPGPEPVPSRIPIPATRTEPRAGTRTDPRRPNPSDPRPAPSPAPLPEPGPVTTDPQRHRDRPSDQHPHAVSERRKITRILTQPARGTVRANHDNTLAYVLVDDPANNQIRRAVQLHIRGRPGRRDRDAPDERDRQSFSSYMHPAGWRLQPLLSHAIDDNGESKSIRGRATRTGTSPPEHMAILAPRLAG